MGEADLHYAKTLLSKFGILCYLCLQAFNSRKARDMRTNVSQPPWSVVVMWLVQSNEMWVEMGAICKLQHLIMLLELPASSSSIMVSRKDMF